MIVSLVSITDALSEFEPSTESQTTCRILIILLESSLHPLVCVQRVVCALLSLIHNILFVRLHVVIMPSNVLLFIVSKLLACSIQ